MKKYTFIFFILSIVLTGCGDSSVDSTRIDNQSDILKNTENISYEVNSGNLNSDFIITDETNYENIENEIKVDISELEVEEALEVLHEDTDLMLDEEKLPQIPGFKFGPLFAYQEVDIDKEQEINYLDLTWIPTYIPSPAQSYGKHTSLYLTNYFYYGTDYGNEKTIEDYNEYFYKLLVDTSNLFGDTFYSHNQDIVDLNDLQGDNHILNLYKTNDYYLLSLIENVEEMDSIRITYYFVSTTIPHSEDDELEILNIIRDIDKNYTLKILYRTNEGDFIF